MNHATSEHSGLHFHATRIARTADMRRLLQGYAESRSVVVADLSLGSWLPQSLATQILSQMLGGELIYKPKTVKPSVSLSLGDAMSAGIDAEARGDATILTAFDTAKQIIAASRKYRSEILIVFGDRPIVWHREDRLLIDYLHVLAPELNIRFIVFGNRMPVWPDSWHVDWEDEQPTGEPIANHSISTRLPSAISPNILASCTSSERDALLPLGNGWAIVCPEVRLATADLPIRFSRAEIESIATGPSRRYAPYARFHGDGDASDSAHLCHEAWLQFDVGYRELGFSYLKQALAFAGGADREIVLCQIQAMRVATARYKDSAAIDLSDIPSNSPVRGFMLQTKGWGAVMSGSAEEARQCLSEAISLCSKSLAPIPRLFLMNIKALAEMRCGDHETAHALERHIEDTISKQKIDDARLRFINAMNLARLLRYSGKFDEAIRYYDFAFSTVDGGRSVSDQINANLSRARVEEAKGNKKNVFYCWLRAALHWVASECPESLGWRVQSLILGRNVTISPESMKDVRRCVESIAEAFLTTLSRYDAEIGRETSRPSTSAAPHRCIFIASDRINAQIVPLRCIGGQGWSVTSAKGLPPNRHYGPHHIALVDWLSGWIQRDAYRHEQCYIVDISNGAEMPVDENALCGSALEFGVVDISYNGEDRHLSKNEIETLRFERRLTISPMVSHLNQDVEKTTVHFRRYFRPYELTMDERYITSIIGAGIVMGSLMARVKNDNFSEQTCTEVLKNLRKKHIVKLALPQHANRTLETNKK